MEAEAEVVDTDNFTYEAEVLPEIEIRELVSFEELVAALPSFVAFSEDEVLHLMSQLVEDKHKGRVFQQVYNAVIKKRRPSQEHIVPVLAASVEEVTDEKLTEIIREFEEANEAPNYLSQMDQIAKIMYPLEKLHGTYRPVIPVTVGLAQDTKKRFVLLPKDIVAQELYGIAFRPITTTNQSYLHEKSNTHQIPPFPNTDDIQVGQSIDEAVIDFQRVCDEISTLYDAHSLRVHLSRFGYNFDMLNEQQLQLLISKLKTLIDDDNVGNDKSDLDADSKASMFAKPTISRHDMWETFSQALERPIDKDKYFTAWQSIASMMQLAAPAVDIPYDAVEIANGLKDNKFTMEDVIAMLKYERSLAQYKLMKNFLDGIQATSIEDIGPLLDKHRNQWSRIFAAYVDRVNQEFVETYRDMTEVKEGRQEDGYIGDADTYVFEEQANIPLNMNDDDVDEMDDVDVENDGVIPNKTYDLSSVSSGCKEVLEHVLPKLMKVKESSGLPLDINALISYISSNVVRISRSDYLQAAVPQLAVDKRNQLLSMDMERALHITQFITPSSIIPPLKEAIITSWKSYESDARSVFILATGWWVLDIQQKALARELTFDTMRGFLPCIRKFSPWGPPLQADKGEGVLEYITCVAKETNVWHHSSEELKQSVMRIWEGDARIDDMKALYKELGKNVASMNERAKAANLSLAEAIENKQKQRYLPEYVKAYMLLPGLLASYQNKVAYGCCLQKIGQSFRADSDWRGVLKRVGNVKDAFAKKRMTMVEMPPYMHYSVANVQDEVHELNNTTSTLSLDPLQQFSFQEWMNQWSTLDLSFITPDMVQMAYSDINKANGLTEKFIQMAAITAGTKSSFYDFLQAQASWTHFDQALNIIITTLHRESKAYDDGVEKDALKNGINDLKTAKKHMQNLKGIFQDVEFSLIKPLYAHILSRAICLPAVPESTSTKRLVLTGATYNTNFLTKTVKATLDELRSFASAKNMPSIDEHKEFITNVREQQKVEVLEVLDKKNIDDRQLLLDAKKLGLVQLVQKPTGRPEDDDDQNAVVDDEEAGLDEYRYNGQNQDENDMEGLNDE